MKLKLTILFAISILAIAGGCDNNDYHYYEPDPPGNERDKLPAVTTGPASEVGGVATLNGQVTSQGSPAATEWGICIDDKPLSTTKIQSSSANNRSFYITVENLDQNKTYYYRAYAINRVGIAYGRELNFKLGSLPPAKDTLPTVVTGSVSSSGMKVNATASITSDGGHTVTERGFCYSTTPDPTVENSTKVNVSLAGNFSTSIGELAPNTSYYVRAYATNSVGTGYGDVIMVLVEECAAHTLPFNMDFNKTTTFPPPCWEAIDHDGDGHGWIRDSYNPFQDRFAALSQSKGLNPYNLLITPKIRISGTNPAVRWSVWSIDNTKYTERYKLVIAEVPITNSNCEDPNIVKTLYEETLTTHDYNSWVDRWWPRREYVHLADYIGKDVYFAWVHYNSNDLDGIFIADIDIFDSPYPTPASPFYETFDNGYEDFPPKGWSTLNLGTADYGWSFNWGSKGKTAAVSSSSQEGVWNVIITPQLLISESNHTLTWTVESSLFYHPHENYKVVIANVPITKRNAKDRNVAKTLFEETLDVNAVDTPQNRSVDLSAYIGQPVYIGWVHYDCKQATLRLYNIKVE